ncbi:MULTISPECIES: hypothetical protein [Ralstonia]|jgi:hypothetical protein|uniref:hypothetical protein n=1 Tax=Ralstonia sp. 11b TaxID=3063544 RepID=UPI00261281A6|nr:hypothetical protein [Ralstonia sp. 11b]MDR9383899.1 hypothetical protein [Ralstonia sp. 11b]
MKNFILVAIVASALAGCGNNGSNFEGKWSCDTGALGVITVTIRNNGGDDYIIDNYPMVGKVNTTYKDGKLIGPQNVTFTIDKQSDKLIGLGICEMSRAK